MKKIDMMYAFNDTRKLSDFIWVSLTPEIMPEEYKLKNPVYANDETYSFQQLNNDVLITRVYVDTEFFGVPRYRKQELLLSVIEDPEFKNYLKSLMN